MREQTIFQKFKEGLKQEFLYQVQILMKSYKLEF